MRRILLKGILLGTYLQGKLESEKTFCRENRVFIGGSNSKKASKKVKSKETFLLSEDQQKVLNEEEARRKSFLKKRPAKTTMESRVSCRLVGKYDLHKFLYGDKSLTLERSDHL